jgi:signal transduction histidine kinase
VYCAIFCLGALASEIGAYTALKMAVFAIADRDLQTRLGGIEEFLGEHLPRLSVTRVRDEIKTHTALQPDLLRVDFTNGPTVFEAAALVPYPAKGDLTPRTWTSGSSSHPLRILAVHRTINNLDYDLTLAGDLTVPFAILSQFGLVLLLSLPVVLAAAAAGGHWMAGRALSPVLAITNAARRIDATDLSRRIAVPESRDELQFLAETVNQMLARIENAFHKTIEFTANASHELRTPLAVIRATAEVALMRPPAIDSDPECSDRMALRQILREAERNTALLENMLRLARADSGTAALHLNPTDLTETLRATCKRCEPLAAKRGLHLLLTTAFTPYWVSSDAEYLKYLLLILIDNAIKYTPPGGFVEVSLTSGAQGQVICQVKDTGIGISDSDLPHIFERFFRSDRARSREEGGAGLGLAIAEWIARVHHGRIEVESVLGSGSTFRLLLPQLNEQPVALADVISRGTSLIGRASK